MYGVIPFLKVSCKTMTGEASTGWPKSKVYSKGPNTSGVLNNQIGLKIS